MLCLSRVPGQVLDIGRDIEVQVLEVRGQTVRLGITAPLHTKILRREAQRDEEQVWKEWADRQRYGDNDDNETT